MNSEQRKQLDYFVVCINIFAKENNISPKDAFSYLYQFQGIAYLKEFYEVEHTLTWADTMEALIHVCRKNGGVLQ